MNSSSPVVKVIELLQEVRERTLALITGLDDEQLIGPRLSIVNPLRWEIGHIAWFQEYWILRQMHGRAPMLAGGDSLYDSARVAHETRWDLPLPSKAETITYMQGVLDQVLDLCSQKEDAAELSDDDAYFLSLVLLHEDMHAEAITYTRQTLAFSAPRFDVVGASARTHSPVKEVNDDPLGDVEIPDGLFLLGSISGRRFAFDNEIGAHEIQVQPFTISELLHAGSARRMGGLPHVCRVAGRSHADRNSHASPAELAFRKQNYCPSLGKDSQTTRQPRLDITDV